MSRKRPVLPRLFRRVWAAWARLLPRRSREEWADQAGADVEQILATVQREQGTPQAVWAGFRAVGDLVVRIGAEWANRLGGRASRPGRTDAGKGRPHMGEEWMNWMTDLRVAVRTLLRRPGYTGAAVLTLALGIGGSVAIFTVVDAVLLRPLPYPEADRIVSIHHHASGIDLPDLNQSDGTLRFYREEADFLGPIGAYDVAAQNLVGGARPERVQTARVSAETFDVLRVRPALGRSFTADDAEPGAVPVAILTHATWTERFGADPSALGHTLELDGVETEVVGVMPEGFAFPDPEITLLRPLYIDPDAPFGAFGRDGIARLAAGVTLDAAAARASELQARLPDFFPELTPNFLDQAGWSVTLERWQDRVVGPNVASTLWLVLATVGVVLLIACANVANLFLVRAESRRKELAVRAAMGAGGSHVARSFLAESLPLAIGGGLLGCVLAWVGVALLVARGPADIPRIHEVALDLRGLTAAALLALACGALLSVLPVLRYRASVLADLLRAGGRGSTDGRERHRARTVLVAGQLAMTLVLVVGSSLMLRSFQAVRTVDPGFDPGDVVTVGLSLGEGVSAPEAASFYGQVADRVAALPGVASVGISPMVPLLGGSSNGGSFYLQSQPRDEDDVPPVAMYKDVGADYLESLGQPLLEGRNLTRADGLDGPPVVLVNETFARRFLDGDAIGEGIRWGENGEFIRVVGVVGDVREMELTSEPRAWGYLPLGREEGPSMSIEHAFLVVRTEGGVAFSGAAVREIVAEMDASVPLTAVRTMREVFAEETARTSFTLTLLVLAALTALFLGAVGLFGVVSYVVGRRTREIGVRVALGAKSTDIRAMVIRQGLGPVVAGVVIGLGAALVATRLMSSVLYGVSVTDPLSFAVAPAVLVAVASLATWLPARRAARVDPTEALGTE